jgi:ADP-heptose:LPS heptosyltransferase
MNISIRLEGGLGDHLLGNRFVHAIKDKYPEADLQIFSDTENNSSSINILKSLFPSLYKNTTTIAYRKDKNHKISTRFGAETYPAHINNLPDDILKEINKSDKFYDLQIDGLKWLNYDFDWLRYYYFFPQPEINIGAKYGESYIMTHLYSRPNSPYNMDQAYVIDLLKKISVLLNQKVLVLTTDEHKDYYKEVFNDTNIIIDTSDNLLDVFKIANGCSLFLGIDSGIRYIPYHFSKPVFVFSKYCNSYGSVTPSHLIRWLLFQKNVFPINFNTNILLQIINNCISNKAYQLFPEYLKDIDSIVVNRRL